MMKLDFLTQLLALLVLKERCSHVIIEGIAQDPYLARDITVVLQRMAWSIAMDKAGTAHTCANL